MFSFFFRELKKAPLRSTSFGPFFDLSRPRASRKQITLPASCKRRESEGLVELLGTLKDCRILRCK